MKKIFVISLIIFWTITAPLLTAGFVIYELKKGGVQLNNNNQGLGIENTENLSGNGATKKVLGASVVAKHNKQSDCWMVIDGKVYDVTTYISLHPGGSGSIVNKCGKDASSLFAGTLGGHIHSALARSLLIPYFVGNFQNSSATGSSANSASLPVSTPPTAVDLGATNLPSGNDSAISASVVAQHNKQNDCWMVISGKIYNVTTYISLHPGGAGSISNGCGKDSSSLFAGTLGGHIHSALARSLLIPYYVGDLQTGAATGSSINSTLPPATAGTGSGDDDEDDD